MAFANVSLVASGSSAGYCNLFLPLCDLLSCLCCMSVCLYLTCDRLLYVYSMWVCQTVCHQIARETYEFFLPGEDWAGEKREANEWIPPSSWPLTHPTRCYCCLLWETLRQRASEWPYLWFTQLKKYHLQCSNTWKYWPLLFLRLLPPSNIFRLFRNMTAYDNRSHTHKHARTHTHVPTTPRERERDRETESQWSNLI